MDRRTALKAIVGGVAAAGTGLLPSIVRSTPIADFSDRVIDCLIVQDPASKSEVVLPSIADPGYTLLVYGPATVVVTGSSGKIVLARGEVMEYSRWKVSISKVHQEHWIGTGDKIRRLTCLDT